MLILNLAKALKHPLVHSHIAPQKKTLFFSTALIFISSALQLLGLYFLLLFLEKTLLSHCLYSLICWTISALSYGSSSFLAHKAENKISHSLKKSLIEKLALLSTKKRTKYDENEMKRLLNEDVSNLHHAIAHLPSELSVFIISPLISLVLILTITGFQGLLTIVPAILASLYYLWIVPKTTARDGEARIKVMHNMISAVNDYCRGVKVNRIFGQSTGALKTYLTAADEFTLSMTFWVKKVATFAAIATAFLQPVATLTIGYYVAKDKGFLPLACTLFFSLTFIAPVLKLGHGLDYLQSGIRSALRITDFFSLSTLNQNNNLLFPNENQDISLTIKNIHITGDNITSQELNIICLPRKITVLMGASGSGKSTLLRMIAGFDDIKEDSILFNSLDAANLSLKNRHQWVSYMPQKLNLISGTIEENLNILEPNIEPSKILDMLRRLNFEHNTNTPVSQLSGGERQRLLLVLSLLRGTPIILLDEPTSALNKELSILTMKIIKEHVERHNNTVLLVTHDEEVASLADKVYKLDGQIIL